MGAHCTRAYSTDSPTLEWGTVPDMRTFSGTLFANSMLCCDRVAAGMTTNCQHIAHNRAGVINTLMYVNHDPSSYWGNNSDMPSDIIVLHKVTQLQLGCWRHHQKPFAE